MPETWTVRGVDPETKAAVRVAARRAGKTMGQWINNTLLRAATDEAVERNQPPAPRLEETLAKLVKTMERQNRRLARLEQRKPFLARLFSQ